MIMDGDINVRTSNVTIPKLNGFYGEATINKNGRQLTNLITNVT